MEKRTNKYHLSLKQISAKNEAPLPAPMELTFDNHDDLFSIVERVQQKNLFGNAEEEAQFIIGLKMFSEIMLKHRTNPLFSELGPALKEFMPKLKAA